MSILTTNNCKTTPGLLEIIGSLGLSSFPRTIMSSVTIPPKTIGHVAPLPACLVSHRPRQGSKILGGSKKVVRDAIRINIPALRPLFSPASRSPHWSLPQGQPLQQVCIVYYVDLPVFYKMVGDLATSVSVLFVASIGFECPQTHNPQHQNGCNQPSDAPHELTTFSLSSKQLGWKHFHKPSTQPSWS
jgi:hypothetical protein